jgi:hypothetical protein
VSKVFALKFGSLASMNSLATSLKRGISFMVMNVFFPTASSIARSSSRAFFFVVPLGRVLHLLFPC